MKYSLEISAAPAAEPLTLAETKLHLRVDHTTDDTLISALITAARQWAENWCRRSFVQRTYKLRMDCFPAAIRLPFGVVASVTSVKYTDADGNLATVSAADYQVDVYSIPARIVPQLGVTWPIPKAGAINAVTVEYVAGYAPGATSPTDHAANVPEAVKAALKLTVAHLYEHREAATEATLAETPFAVKALLTPYAILDYTLE
jgi:uncharacterized phiE125 gp8 family phage protein